ncbi:MAG: hypothetical protein HZA93_21145 [Verrucomicrobia bacterium]|nr:hypothetical protein [Verrucomicrobiota bacterium]
MSETIHQLDLPALDGANPLGFLAALGTLRVLSETDPTIKLGWHARARWVPYLYSPNLQGGEDEKYQDVLQRLATRLCGKPVDAEKVKVREAAQERFDSAKTRLKEAVAAFKGLNLPRGKERDTAREKVIVPYEQAFTAAREEFLAALPESVPSAELALGQRPDCTIEEFRRHARTMIQTARITSRATLDMLASFGGELSCSDEEKIESTPFSFLGGAGHQWFLDTARELMAKTSETKLREALITPWSYADEKLTMRWDPLDDRRYALMDRDPTATDNKSTTVWMANLLGYVALAFFPCAPISRGSATACWADTEEAPRFRWPLWVSPLSANSVSSLLTHASMASTGDESSTRELRSRGVAAVFSCHRLRNGKFTNFSPATAV